MARTNHDSFPAGGEKPVALAEQIKPGELVSVVDHNDRLQATGRAERFNPERRCFTVAGSTLVVDPSWPAQRTMSGEWEVHIPEGEYVGFDADAWRELRREADAKDAAGYAAIVKRMRGNWED